MTSRIRICSISGYGKRLIGFFHQFVVVVVSWARVGVINANRVCKESVGSCVHAAVCQWGQTLCVIIVMNVLLLLMDCARMLVMQAP